MLGIVDGDDVGRLAGRVGAHRFRRHVVEMDLPVDDLDVGVFLAEFLGEVEARLAFVVLAPDGDGDGVGSMRRHAERRGAGVEHRPQDCRCLHAPYSSSWPTGPGSR